MVSVGTFWNTSKDALDDFDVKTLETIYFSSHFWSEFFSRDNTEQFTYRMIWTICLDSESHIPSNDKEPSKPINMTTAKTKQMKRASSFHFTSSQHDRGTSHQGSLENFPSFILRHVWCLAV